ncbi:hypothetical protein GIB67_002979 [Kingdonia uniflora]|uniref:Glabrous enhancer-binding protein-like DBD domain-containing protein n=1 Tax=Kingdonia uniflora TaxID=39325 RepID=A0A7J7LE96_9MAGN|nr:hypothetical protein GIB67_002979 [Kingdonia uniflora]
MASKQARQCPRWRSDASRLRPALGTPQAGKREGQVVPDYLMVQHTRFVFVRFSCELISRFSFFIVAINMAPPKPGSGRIWTHEEEVLILQHMARKPSSNSLHEFVKLTICPNISHTQLMAKIGRMKSKYNNYLKKNGRPRSGTEEFYLWATDVWGVDNTTISNDSESVPPPSSSSSYPILTLSDEIKSKELEESWKNLHEAELKNYRVQIELIQENQMLIEEAQRAPWLHNPRRDLENKSSHLVISSKPLSTLTTTRNPSQEENPSTYGIPEPNKSRLMSRQPSALQLNSDRLEAVTLKAKKLGSDPKSIGFIEAVRMVTH